VAPLYVGIKQGFFKEENLTIQPQLAEGGATITAQTVSGDLQIGFSNTTSLVIASSKGLPVQIIAQGVQGAETEKDAWDAVLSKKGSAIKDAKGLEGQTVSVNNLNNVGPLTINNAMEKAGADFKKVKYTEVPFPDANAALETGRVDGAWVVEPFVSQGVGQGANEVIHPYEQMAPNYTVATYFVTKQYAAQNKDVVTGSSGRSTSPTSSPSRTPTSCARSSRPTRRSPRTSRRRCACRSGPRTSTSRRSSRPRTSRRSTASSRRSRTSAS
jgi:NitT/TauT family transport system substrate-binding protein